MPRSKGQKANQPAYRYHVSGQARVTLDGVDFYLGEHDSPKSWRRYFVLLGEYNRLGQRAPDPDLFNDSKRIEEAKKRKKKGKGKKTGKVTVEACTAIFRPYVKSRYTDRRNPRRIALLKLCDLLDLEYGNWPAEDFRPRHLLEVRGLCVRDGNSRNYVNEQSRRLIEIFDYAATEGDLISEKITNRLRGVKPVREGQAVPQAGGCVPREKKKHPTVDLAVVKATAEHLSPTIKAMIVIQAATGMRPSEVCRMTPGQVDTSGEIWIYRPAKHKSGTQEDNPKAIPIVHEAKLALAPFLDRPSDQPCFSPKESRQWHLDQRAKNRKTRPRQGNFAGSRAIERAEKELPPPQGKGRPGEMYTSDSYRRAIQRAAEKADDSPWETPASSA